MKAITLWQPWASLIACGAKTIETRSWGTPYRGPLAIHASKRMNQELIEEWYRCQQVLQREKFRPQGDFKQAALIPLKDTLTASKPLPSLPKSE